MTSLEQCSSVKVSPATSCLRTLRSDPAPDGIVTPEWATDSLLYRKMPRFQAGDERYDYRMAMLFTLRYSSGILNVGCHKFLRGFHYGTVRGPARSFDTLRRDDNR